MQLLFFFLLLFFLPLTLSAEIKGVVQIEKGQTSTLPTIEGTIAITHDSKTKVDPNSFQIQGKPLAVQFIKTEQNAKDSASPEIPDITSFYHFRIPHQTAGLHLLPAISFLVDGKKYQSAPTTYEIVPGQVNIQGPLHLSAEIVGNTFLYPGQRAKFVYRIFYQGTIDLTREVLPLLEAQGLEKVGGIEIKEYTLGEYDVQEISQQVQAKNPQKLIFPSSFIEGILYRRVPGQVNPARSKISAESPEIELEILPFPEQGRPTSFNGAIGNFVYQIRLLSSPRLNLGDTLKLEIAIHGQGEMETLSLPDISCQPGFSGFFDFGDLPPGEKNERGYKVFLLELKPLSTLIDHIPSIEFSSFDPRLQVYHKANSQPIRLKVTTLQTELQEKLKSQQRLQRVADDQEDVTSNWQKILSSPPKIDLYPQYSLEPKSQWIRFLTSWLVLLLAPITALLLAGQMLLKRFLTQFYSHPVLKTSDDYLNDAQNALSQDPDLSLSLIEKALFLGMKEKGLIKQPVTSSEELPMEGLSGSIRSFLSQIEKVRFAGEQGFPTTEILRQARHWHAKIMKEDRLHAA